MQPTTCKGFSSASAARKREPAEMIMGAEKSGFGLSKQMLNRISLIHQFPIGSLHFFLTEFADFQIRNDMVAPLLADHGKTIHNTLRNPVATVRRDSHRYPVVFPGAENPVPDMVDGGIGGTGGTGEATSLDYLGTAILYRGNEVVFYPGRIVDEARDFVATHLGMIQVRILFGGMIAPDDHFSDARN